ncbi:MAG: PEP-CTERM sorting domain-containing protein [Phycisphaeraceae bacterium]
MKPSILISACVAVVCSLTPPAQCAVPSPGVVFGKEYSNFVDKNIIGALDPHQNIGWDGFGGVFDAFDYTAGVPFPLVDHEVDAIANSRDRFFSAVTSDAAPMLLSLSGTDNIHFQDVGFGGATGIWATAAEINGMPGAPDDVDGLEVWGPVDSNHFSMLLDPAPGPGSPDVAVWYYDGVSVGPYILSPDLATALGDPDEPELIDLDALMVFDKANDGIWAPGDKIMFSVRSTIGAGGIFDGGEIWVWTNGSPAAFLVHGGITWDTANGVGALFGVPTEEIDALEAVPEPGTFGLLAVMLMGTVASQRRGAVRGR